MTGERSRRRDKSRVCLVTQWFPPEPAFVADGIARVLLEHGWEVEVLSGHPNYPTGVIYDGYGPAWSTRRNVESGLTVRRTPLFPSHDASPVRRALNYLTWSASASIFGARSLRRADVVLVYASPATAAIPALVGRWVFRTPMVLMIQDLWPDSVVASGFLRPRRARMAQRLLHVFMGVLYRSAAHVIAISPGMLARIRDRGVEPGRSSVVFNWASEDAFVGSRSDGSLRHALGLSADDFVLMYAGNHGPAQALDVLVDAVQALPRDLRCHLVLVGGGVSKEGLVAKTAVEGGRVHFLPSVPQAQLGAMMREADVQCVSLADEPVFEITVPSKMQNIMSIGLPLLVVARGDAAAIADRSLGGVSVAPGDVHALVRTIEGLVAGRDRLAGMGDSARKYYEREMSRRVGGDHLDSVLRSVQ